jgi:hypothetical protein
LKSNSECPKKATDEPIEIKISFGPDKVKDMLVDINQEISKEINKLLAPFFQNPPASD